MRILAAALAVTIGCGGAPAPTSTTPAATPTTSAKPVGTPPTDPVLPTTPVSTAPLGPTSVIAKLDGVAITLADIDRQVQAALASGAELAATRWRVLNELIDNKLLLAGADHDLIGATDAEVDAALQEIATQNKLTEAELVDVLKKQGFTLAIYREELRAQIRIIRYVNAKIAKGPREEAHAKVVAHLRAKAKIELFITEPTSKPPAKLAPAVIEPGDVQAVVKHAIPTYTTDTLGDEADSASYTSRHFKADGKSEASDFAYRAWRHPAADAKAKFAALQKDIPNTKPLAAFATQAFTASEDHIVAVGFFDAKTSIVVLVTCGTDVCSATSHVIDIAKVLLARIAAIDAALK